MKTPRSILVIPLRYLGDTILTVPLLRNLHQQFPDAAIDVLCSKTAAPLLEPSPYIRHVLIEPKGTMARLQQLQGGYDLAFVLRKSVTMAAMCKLAGIPRVIGYDKQRFPWGYKRWGWFLDATARYPSLRTETPQPVSHLQLLAATGLPTGDSALELWATPEEEAKVQSLLANRSGKRAGLHLASASHGKTFAPKKFLPALKLLHQAGYTVYCTGTAGDQDLYASLTEQSGVPLVNLAGQTSLRETFSLYQQLDLLLTVDSSPIHFGAAAGIPQIVGVFGPTNERQWGPHHPAVTFHPVFLDLPCRPCYAKVCSHNRCRVDLSELQIEAAVRRALDGLMATRHDVAHLK